MAPTTWTAECCAQVLWARGLIEMIHPAITTEDWSLMDCQEYFVDLETSLTGVATALEISGPGQLRDDQMGVYRELELKVGVACGLANKLRARHLENYDLRGIPVGDATPSEIIEKLKAGRLKLDAELSAGQEVRQREQRAESSRADPRAEEDPRRPSAPLPSPPDWKTPSEGAWPWFSGQLDDLLWFKRAWEDHIKCFHHGLSLEVLVGGLHKYFMAREMGKVIEQASNPTKAWSLLESHFDRQTALVDGLVLQLLNSERAVNDAQILA